MWGSQEGGTNWTLFWAKSLWNPRIRDTGSHLVWNLLLFNFDKNIIEKKIFEFFQLHSEEFQENFFLIKKNVNESYFIIFLEFVVSRSDIAILRKLSWLTFSQCYFRKKDNEQLNLFYLGSLVSIYFLGGFEIFTKK